MPSFFIDRPIFAWVVALFIALFGVLAIPNMPVAQYPDVAPTTIEITANYPGASAAQIAESVTSLIERELNGAVGLMYHSSSSSSSGRATIVATFEPGTDPAMAQIEVQNRIARVEPRLPGPVLQQGLQIEKATAGYLLVAALSSDSADIDDVALGDYVSRSVIEEIRRVPGVGRATVFGSERAMRVWIDPAKLTGLNLQPSNVLSAIAAQNAQISAGTVGDLPSSSEQQFTATVSVRGQLATPEEFGNIILRAERDGSTVRLRDVARIEVGRQTYQISTRLNGKPAAAIAVQLAPGANALATADGVRAALDNLSQFFPAGVSYDIAFNTAPFVEISIRSVVYTFLEAIVLVFLVMFLFLQNIRYTLIPTLVVPIALLGTFAVLYLLGLSVNVLTLFGMVLAIGILVDDAIIVVESTERLMAEEGLSPRDAVRKAMHQITGAIVGITLVLVAVFVPLAFMSGSVGVIYRQFSVSMAVSVALSGFLALTLTPALCATLLKPIPQDASRHRTVRGGLAGRLDRALNGFNHLFGRTSHRYLRGVGRMASRPARYMAVFAVILLMTGLLYARLPTDFLPSEDQGQLLVDVQLPPNASANRTVDAVRQIEAYYLGDAEIRRQISAAQATGDQARVAQLEDQLTPTQRATDKTLIVTGSGFSGGGPNAGLGFVVLRDWSERNHDQSVQAIARRAMQDLFALSGIRGGNVMSVMPPAIAGMGTFGGFEFRLLDRSMQGYAALQAAGEELIGKARQSKLINPQGLRKVSMPDTAQILVQIDRDQASALGLSFADINQTLSIAFGSAIANDFPNQGRMQRVILQANSNARMAPEDLLRLNVRNAAGEMVPVSSFAKVEWGHGPVDVNRFNGYPALQISGEAAQGVSSGQAMAEMERLAKALPPGFDYEWAGLSRQEQQAGAQVPLLLALSILVVFLVLSALYESWSIPLSVIMMAPLGMLGSVLAVTLAGMPNDVFFTVGLITIIGLSAKNAVLIVEFAKTLHAQGWDLFDATMEAARLRFRPIVMTSLAFGFGVLPLALATGAASASQRAVGVGVIGGVVAATVLAIFFVPVFFVAVSRVFNTQPGDRADASGHAADVGGRPAQEH